MRAKHLVTKLIKLLSSMFPSWKIWGSEIEIKLQQQTFWNVSWQKDVGNCCCLGRTFGRAARLQPIYKKNNQQMKKSFMEESVLFNFPFQTYGNHASDLLIFGHVISERHWQDTFDFTEIINTFGLKRRSVLNCEICFPLFSETISTIFKNISTAWS